MGLLDSDADELKKTAAIEGTSGRKVNQSGLGALKGLSKYSKLTDKYRTKGKDVASLDAPATTVEQLRGTICKSVQENVEVSAKSAHVAPTSAALTVEAGERKQLRANSVQTVELTDSLLSPFGNAEQVRAESVQNVPELSATAFEIEVNKVSTGPSEGVPKSASGATPKSVQTLGASSLKTSLIHSDDIKVSASLIHPTIIERAPGFAIPEATDKRSNSVQSGSEVRANSGRVAPVETTVLATDENRDHVGAKSVQSECVSHSLADHKVDQALDQQVSAMSVRGSDMVGAKSVRSALTSANVPQPSFRRAAGSKRHEIDFEGQGPSISILELSGSQRVVVDFIFNLCLYGNSLITPPVTKQMLLVGTKLKEDTALSSIKRLRTKFVLDRYAYKDGKAGWTQYKLAEQTYKELLHFQQMGGFAQYQAQLPKIQMPQPVVVQTAESHAPTWFKNLDFTPVNINPMAVNPTIRALVQEKLSPEIVQEYLNRFTSWLSTQGKVTSPLGLFCDKLKELAREGDSPVLSCMTEEEREAELSMIKHAERAKAEFELIEKAKQESAAQERAREIDRAFADWFISIGETALREIVPGNAFAEFGSETHKTVARAYFEEKIWRSETL